MHRGLSKYIIYIIYIHSIYIHIYMYLYELSLATFCDKPPPQKSSPTAGKRLFDEFTRPVMSAEFIG